MKNEIQPSQVFARLGKHNPALVLVYKKLR